MLQRRFEPTIRLFHAKGSAPLRQWDVSGEIKHRPSPQGDGFLYELCEGSPPCRIQMPKKGRPPLGLRHKRLVLDLWGDPLLPFTIEIIVSDGPSSADGVTRTLTLSRDCTSPEMTHGSPKAKLPLAANFPLTSAGWRIVDLDLSDLVPRAFDGAKYCRLDGVAVSGACMLRTVEGRAESPPAFTVARHALLAPRFHASGLGRSGAADVYKAADDADEDDYGDDAYDETTSAFAFLNPAQMAAKEAARATKAHEAAKLASRAAQAAFLKAALKSTSADEDEPAPAPPNGAPKLQAAVRART